MKNSFSNINHDISFCLLLKKASRESEWMMTKVYFWTHPFLWALRPVFVSHHTKLWNAPADVMEENCGFDLPFVNLTLCLHVCVHEYVLYVP